VVIVCFLRDIMPNYYLMVASGKNCNWRFRKGGKMMKRLITLLLVTVGLVCVPALTAWAVTDTATQDVAITLEEIAQLAVSGDPATLTLTNASTTAGSLPPAVEDATTSLSWTSNVETDQTRKLTAILSAAYTTGIVLKATVTEPAGTNGTAAAEQTLIVTAVDMFTGITNENCTGATITYEASITEMIAPVTAQSKTVTWTLTEDA